MKIIIYTIYSLVIVFSASCASIKKVDNGSRVAIISSEINRIFEMCKNSLWQGYDLTKRPILLISQSEKSAHQIVNRKHKKIDFEQLPNSLKIFPAQFNVDSYLGQKHLIFMMDHFPAKKMELSLTNIIIHEGFHTFYQDNDSLWLENKSESFRGTFFPVIPKPRYYRWMMFSSLVDYLKSNNKQQLGYFSWWFDKWKRDFPEEYRNYTDRNEGSAEYVSIVSLAIDRKTCFTNSKESFKAFQKYRKSWFKKEEFDLASEAYSIGSLSGIVLDSVLKTWKTKVSKRLISPIEILAKTFEPIEPKDLNTQALREFQNIAKKEMTRMDKSGALRDSLKNLKSEKFYKLFIPGKAWKMGGFSASGMYQILEPTNEIKSLQVIRLGSPVKYVKSTQSVDIELPGHNLMRVRGAPCPDGDVGSVFLINKKTIQNTDKIRVSIDGITFKVNPKTSKNKAWLCG